MLGTVGKIKGQFGGRCAKTGVPSVLEQTVVDSIHRVFVGFRVIPRGRPRMQEFQNVGAHEQAFFTMDRFPVRKIVR